MATAQTPTFSINTLDINNVPLKEVNKGIFGFKMLEQYNVGNLMLNYPAPNSYNNPQFYSPQIDSFANINMQTLRFPPKNFSLYHYAPNKVGYGLDSTELYWNDGDIAEVDFLWITRAQDGIAKAMRWDRQYQRNIIYDLIKFVKLQQAKNNTVINVIYTANIYQHIAINGNSNNTVSPGPIVNNPTYRNVLPGNPLFNTYLSETVNAIKLLKDSSINVVGVEFDNEIYDAYAKMTGFNLNKDSVKINKYIQICKVYNDTLKARFPTIKTALPLKINSGVFAFQSPTTEMGFFNYKMLNANFNDAYSFHQYTSLDSVNSSTCTRMEIYSANPNGNTFLKSVNYQINETLCPSVPNLKQSTHLNTFDYKNKDYWFLEWNTWSDGVNNNANTILQADFYYKNMFSQFMANDRIKYTTFWSLSSVSEQGHLMKHGLDGTPLLEMKSTYYPATFIGQIYKNNLKALDFDWKNWQTIPEFKTSNFTGIDNNNLFIKAFAKQNYEAMYVYYSNMTNKKIRINIDSIRLHYIYSPQGNCIPSDNYILPKKSSIDKVNNIFIKSANGLIGNITTNTWTKYTNTSDSITAYNYRGSDTIYPYSVGYIKIPLKGYFSSYNNNSSVSRISKNIPKQSESIQIYPNPSTDGNFSVSIDENTIQEHTVTLSISDINGREILRQPVEAETFNFTISKFAKGIYLYKISSEEEILKTGKIVYQ